MAEHNPVSVDRKVATMNQAVESSEGVVLSGLSIDEIVGSVLTAEALGLSISKAVDIVNASKEQGLKDGYTPELDWV